ncbi:MAG: hypothetical protein HQK78_00355 [Desulfobacterales bacterium]|nr:hypothetical protein [Desulfobacterales bacterium]
MKDEGSNDFFGNILKIVNFFKYKLESGFLFCACNNQRLIKEINKQIIENAKKHGLNIIEVYISSDDSDNILPILRKATQESPDGIIINNLDELILMSKGEFMTNINMGREILIEMNVPMVFWMSEENISRFANQAPDMFIRRDRSVVCFQDLSILKSSSLERLDDFYQLGFKDTETYSNLSLKIKLLEKQIIEAKEKKYPEERIAIEIAVDLISLYLKASLYHEAFRLFEAYQDFFLNSRNIKLIALCAEISYLKLVTGLA